MTNPPIDTPFVLGGRYRFEERLGSGGMGEVYKAWDATLRRWVAVKRLASSAAPSESLRGRILREARAASALNHRAIVAIHDVVEEGGEAFIVEELAVGAQLRSLLDRPFPLGAFFTFAEECADALVAASARGIVHCDLKPENIILTSDGRPRILDFGIARSAVSETETTTISIPTTPDARDSRLAGTPAYVAPELISGNAPDARSDMFSLGIILYEMLTTRSPFLRATLGETLASVLHDTPPDPSALNPDVPRDLDALVLRMLAKEPGARFASARELLEEIRRVRDETPAGDRSKRGLRRRALLRAAAPAAALAALLTLAMVSPPLRTALLGPAVAISELPIERFKSTSPDSDAVFLAIGMTEAVRTRLAEVLPRVRVVDAGSASGAPVLLDGTVERSGEVIRVRYRLLDRKTGRVLVKSSAIEAKSLLALQDSVTAAIASDLSRKFRLGREAKAARPPTEDVAAYEVFLLARGYLSRPEDESKVETAVDLLERAVTRDPGFVLARAALGEAYWRRYEATRDPRWTSKAEESALAALEADPSLPEVHITLGMIYNGTGKAEQAAREFEKALALDPRIVTSRLGLARAQESSGLLEDAERTFQQATAAYPDDPGAHRAIGAFYARRGRYEDALRSFLEVVRLDAGNSLAHSNLGVIYQMLGRTADAIAAYSASIERSPNYAAYSNLATLLRSDGRFEEAARDYEKALALDDRDYRVWHNLAGTYDKIPGREAMADSALRAAIRRGKNDLAINPNDAELLALLGGWHAELKEPVSARGYLEKALALASGDVEVQFNASAAYETLGDRPQALECARRAIDLGQPIEAFRTDAAFELLVKDPAFEAIASSPVTGGARTPAAADSHPASGEGDRHGASSL